MVRSTALLVLLLLPAAAWAENKPASRAERESAARVACAAGRADEGNEILAALFAEFGHRNYVYNQARCYQQNGRASQAVYRFREYLRLAPDAPAEERTRINGYLAELEAQLPSAPEPPAAAPSGEVAGPAADAPLLLAPATPGAGLRATAAPDRSSLRIAALTIGAAGALGLVTGVVATRQVHSLDEEVAAWGNSTPGAITTQDVADAQARGGRYRTLAAVGFGVGATALVSAAVCAYFGWRTPPAGGPEVAVAVNDGGLHATFRLGL